MHDTTRAFHDPHLGAPAGAPRPPGEAPATLPEGRPAHPRMSPPRITVVLASLAMLVLVVGLVSGLLAGPVTGLWVTSLGIALLLANPVIWATILRARERAAAQRRAHLPPRTLGAPGPHRV